MNKKAISSLIATVLLMVLVVVIGAVIMTYVKTYAGALNQTNNQAAEKSFDEQVYCSSNEIYYSTDNSTILMDDFPPIVYSSSQTYKPREFTIIVCDKESRNKTSGVCEKILARINIQGVKR